MGCVSHISPLKYSFGYYKNRAEFNQDQLYGQYNLINYVYVEQDYPETEFTLPNSADLQSVILASALDQ